MSELYAKLAQRIIYSSIWEEDGDTCKVWVTLLALKDQNGVVDKNITGVARIAKLPIEKVEQAIQMFLEPDERSSSQEHDGRRIRAVPEGWLVLNHQKYQEYGWSEDKKARERMRKAAYRAGQPPPAQINPEPESKTEPAEKEVKEPDWFPSPLQLRLGALFKRRPTTKWSKAELKAFKEIGGGVSNEDLILLETYYSAAIPIKYDYRRHDLSTFLNNFNGEVDRARKYQPPSCF